MSVVRVIALKDFLANALSTSQQTTPYNLGQLTCAEKIYGALHLTQAYATTDRVLVADIQSATASGFGTPSSRITFALSTVAGSTWGTPIGGASTEHLWYRGNFTMSTAASTGGSWKGLLEVGISS